MIKVKLETVIYNLLCALLFLSIATQAYSIDQSSIIGKQITRQVRSGIADSIYGSMVKPKLEIKDTAGKLKHARYFSEEKIFLQYFSDGQLIVWDLGQGAQVDVRKLSRKEEILFYDKERHHLFVKNKDRYYRVGLSGDREEITAAQLPSKAKESNVSNYVSGANELLLEKNGTLKIKEAGALRKIAEDVVYATFTGDHHYLYVKQDGVTYLMKTWVDYYLLSIVPAKTGWVVVDHEGRFDGTVSGMKDVTWDAGGDELTLDQFFDAYYQPGLLSAYIKDDRGGLNKLPANFEEGIYLPPKIELDFPEGRMKPDAPYKVVVVAESRGGELDEDVFLFHNGKRLPDKTRVGSQVYKQEDKYLLVSVFAMTPVKGANEIYAVSKNLHGVMARSDVKKEVTKGYQSKGTLHLIGIGVDQYRQEELELNYAVKDVSSVLSRIQAGAGKVYDDVVVTRLMNSAATQKGVKNLLHSLQKVRSEDSVILVLAGHGTYEKREWYFLPHDVNVNSIRRTAITAKDLQDALIDSPAQKMFLLVDSCNSGGGIDTFNHYKNFQRRFVQQMGRSAGLAVLTAARKDQYAWEAKDMGHGLFTYTVLQGLDGFADQLPRDGNISAHELARYVAEAMMKNVRDIMKVDRIPQDPAHFVIGSDLLLSRKNH